MRHGARLNIGLLVGTLVALVTGGTVLALGADGGDQGAGLSASAQVRGAPGSGVRGTVWLVQLEGRRGQPTPTVLVNARIRGLAPGRHGFHIHENASCEAPFRSAGGHFDPGPAGNSDPDANHPYHLGDLPNLRVNAQGVGRLEHPTTRITLSQGPTSVLDADGSAVIVHLNEDQGITGPSGSGVSGGPRLACGVLRLDDAEAASQEGDEG